MKILRKIKFKKKNGQKTFKDSETDDHVCDKSQIDLLCTEQAVSHL